MTGVHAIVLILVGASKRVILSLPANAVVPLGRVYLPIIHGDPTLVGTTYMDRGPDIPSVEVVSSQPRLPEQNHIGTRSTAPREERDRGVKVDVRPQCQQTEVFKCCDNDILGEG